MNFLNSLYVQLITSMDSLKSAEGQGLVEYALILVLIAIVVIAIVRLKWDAAKMLTIYF